MKKILKLQLKVNKKEFLKWIITNIIYIIISCINISIMIIKSSYISYLLVTLNITSLIIYFIYSFKDIIQVIMLEENNIKLKNLECYNKTLTSMYDSVRGFRHDFSNFVQALNGYVQTNNIEGIKNMSSSILKDCRSVNNMGTLDPNIINNPAVYSILTNKFFLAQENDIEMNIEVMIDMNDIKIGSYELCRILSILLDNAIEAAKECEEKIINVRFIKDIKKVNRKLIIIENSYNMMDIDINKIFEKGYSTKTNPLEKEKHGLGLWTVRKILTKSKNLNLFTTKGNMFSQQLEIYEV